MKTLMAKHRSRIAARFACLAVLTLTFATANAAWPPAHAGGDELAVWQAMAGIVASEGASRPYKQWYFKSDFAASSFISIAVADPDRDEFCGLSSQAVQTMISELKAINDDPIVLDLSVVESAGFRIGRKKDPNIPYFAMSRVVFDPERDSAWLSLELNGSRGSIVRLDKIDGKWQRTARCGGWYMPD